MDCALAAWVHDWSPFVLKLGDGFGLRWYGLAYVGAFAFAFWLVRWQARQGYSDLKSEQVGDFIMGTAIFGVLLGGRLGYMLFYDFGHFVNEPWSIVRVWDGGMSSHGGILGIVVFTAWYAWRHKYSWTGLGDNLVVAAPVGLFLGRLANFINGELYGRLARVPWAMKFPKELYGDAVPGNASAAVAAAVRIDPTLTTPWQVADAAYEDIAIRAAIADFLSPRHPSQIYEALLEGLLLFVILLFVRLRWKRLRRGLLTGLFFIGYALVRILAEIYREPDAALTLGLTRGQFLSLFMIVMGVGFLALPSCESLRCKRGACKRADYD